MMTSAFRVWIRPGTTPKWGKVRVLRQKSIGVDEQELVIDGDGLNLEQLVRQQPDVFVMFERIDADGMGMSTAP